MKGRQESVDIHTRQSLVQVEHTEARCSSTDFCMSVKKTVSPPSPSAHCPALSPALSVHGLCGCRAGATALQILSSSGWTSGSLPTAPLHSTAHGRAGHSRICEGSGQVTRAESHCGRGGSWPLFSESSGFSQLWEASEACFKARRETRRPSFFVIT